MTGLATCPECQHLVKVTPSGVLAQHLRDGVLVVKVRHKRWVCKGSGRWPRRVDR
jgi:hypothetical protein